MKEELHILILKAFDELKFNLGKKTFIDFLKGNENQTIERNNLDELNSFGILYSEKEETISNLIEILIEKNLIQILEIRGGYKVITRTLLGSKEIIEKRYKNLELTSKLKEKNKTNFLSGIETQITDNDKKIFKTFDFFLKDYNDEQKKAIISNSKNILCIAGAGTGKTTTLVKKIEFLKKFKNIKEEKILAITFTKKARDEMKNRLNELNIKKVKIETFNSFCEKILKKHETKIYSRHTRVIAFKEKIQLLNYAIKKTNTNFELMTEKYFSKKQLREKSKEELFFIFINDIFTILDFYKNTNLNYNKEKIEKFYEKEKSYGKRNIAKKIFEIVILVEKELKRKNLRDFSDQIIDTLNFFKNNTELIPKFEHLLIDEFQDLNLPQFELIKILNPENLFAVGDPRQAIYGWRGSNIKFILNFPKEFKNTEIISLKKNYRSDKKIVELFNLSIKKLNLTDLIAAKKPNKNSKSNSIFLQEFNSEELERIFILEAIKNSKNPRNEIFVLARTNRILEKYVDLLRNNGIDFIIKSEEEYNTKITAKENQITLATVHSIKGMEAKEVYIVNANTTSFPNKAQDNFVLSLIKKENYYDKEEEELRLFYVALSRAKEKLIITYTGTPTKFLTDEMLSLFNIKKKKRNLFEFYQNQDNKNNSNTTKKNTTIITNMLKDWRREKAEELDLPLYMIITNKTIEDLALKLPQSKAELFNINGLGPSKIQKYSEEILKIING